MIYLQVLSVIVLSYYFSNALSNMRKVVLPGGADVLIALSAGVLAYSYYGEVL